MRIAAIVLAAGEGRRLGGAKALMPIDGVSFVEHVVALYARSTVASVVVVIGHDAERVAARVPRSAVTIVNTSYADGMLSSVLRGLDASPDADAVLLHPVDHPLVEAATIDAVVDALARGATIAVPSFENRRGHPGGFARAAWPALRSAAPDAGARAVLAAHPEWLIHVAGGPGCLAGINTPGDYERLIGRRSSGA